jgi:hypothetical protein
LDPSIIAKNMKRIFDVFDGVWTHVTYNEQVNLNPPNSWRHVNIHKTPIKSAQITQH